VILYGGKQHITKGVSKKVTGISSGVVLALIQTLLDRKVIDLTVSDFTVIMDNWYTSYGLFKRLDDLGNTPL
jgi:hypothetical protein